MVQCKCWLKIYCVPPDPVTASNLAYFLKQNGINSVYTERTNLVTLNALCEIFDDLTRLLSQKCIDKSFRVEGKCWGVALDSDRGEKTVFFERENIAARVIWRNRSIKFVFFDIEKLHPFILQRIKNTGFGQSGITEHVFFFKDEDRVRIAIEIMNQFTTGKRRLSM